MSAINKYRWDAECEDYNDITLVEGSLPVRIPKVGELLIGYFQAGDAMVYIREQDDKIGYMRCSYYNRSSMHFWMHVEYGKLWIGRPSSQEYHRAEPFNVLEYNLLLLAGLLL